MKELTQANVNVLGERVRCLMGNAAESSLPLMIRDLGKQISECGENRLDVVFRLGFELDDRGDYCFDLGLDWTRKIKHKDSFETVRVNFDQPPLPGMDDDGSDVAPSGKQDEASAKSAPKQVGGEAVRLLGPGPVVDIDTTLRPVEDLAGIKVCCECKYMNDGSFCQQSNPFDLTCDHFEAAISIPAKLDDDLAEHQTCGGCKYMKDQEFCESSNPDSLACDAYEEAEDAFETLVPFNEIHGLNVWEQETAGAIEVTKKVFEVDEFEVVNAQKLNALCIVPLIEDNDGYSLLRVVAFATEKFMVDARKFKTKQACKNAIQALNIYSDLLMFIGHEHIVLGKINALFRRRFDGSVWMADNHRSWCKADVQDIEVWRARADALEA